MSDYRFKSVWGEVMTVEEKVLQSGKFIASVRVKDDKGEIWVCTLWDDVASSFLDRNLKGTRVYIEGGLRDGNCISAKFYDVFKHAVPQSVEREGRREYEPVTTVTEHDKNRVKITYLERNGLRTYQIRPKSDCLKVNGLWERKIDYCIRNMGGEEVTTWLREYGSFAPVEVVGGGKVSMIGDAKGYQLKLVSMIEACAKHHGDYVELYGDERGVG